MVLRNHEERGIEKLKNHRRQQGTTKGRIGEGCGFLSFITGYGCSVRI